jgi:hypothetical protein
VTDDGPLEANVVLYIESTMAHPKRGSLQHALEVKRFRDKYQIRIG